jgi:hypothetical protein
LGKQVLAGPRLTDGNWAQGEDDLVELVLGETGFAGFGRDHQGQQAILMVEGFDSCMAVHCVSALGNARTYDSQEIV